MLKSVCCLLRRRVLFDDLVGSDALPRSNSSIPEESPSAARSYTRSRGKIVPSSGDRAERAISGPLPNSTGASRPATGLEIGHSLGSAGHTAAARSRSRAPFRAGRSHALPRSTPSPPSATDLASSSRRRCDIRSRDADARLVTSRRFETRVPSRQRIKN